MLSSSWLSLVVRCVVAALLRESKCDATKLLVDFWLCDASWLHFFWWHNINLVDPASSHMLVSKVKPCMSKYKLLYSETANGSLKQLLSPWQSSNLGYLW